MRDNVLKRILSKEYSGLVLINIISLTILVFGIKMYHFYNHASLYYLKSAALLDPSFIVLIFCFMNFILLAIKRNKFMWYFLINILVSSTITYGLYIYIIQHNNSMTLFYISGGTLLFCLIYFIVLLLILITMLIKKRLRFLILLANLIFTAISIVLAYFLFFLQIGIANPR